MTSYHHGDYLMEFVYGTLGAGQRSEIAELWVSSGVLPPEEASRRLDEVLMTLRNAQGDLVGVNTVYVQDLLQPGNPYYFYRIFIREQDRGGSLRTAATRVARQRLKEYQAVTPQPRGIVIVTENRKYERPGAVRLLRRQGWHYLGRGPRGYSIWFENFDCSDSIYGA